VNYYSKEKKYYAQLKGSFEIFSRKIKYLFTILDPNMQYFITIF